MTDEVEVRSVPAVKGGTEEGEAVVGTDEAEAVRALAATGVPEAGRAFAATGVAEAAAGGAEVAEAFAATGGTEAFAAAGGADAAEASAEARLDVFGEEEEIGLSEGGTTIADTRGRTEGRGSEGLAVVEEEEREDTEGGAAVRVVEGVGE